MFFINGRASTAVPELILVELCKSRILLTFDHVQNDHANDLVTLLLQ